MGLGAVKTMKPVITDVSESSNKVDRLSGMCHQIYSPAHGCDNAAKEFDGWQEEGLHGKTARWKSNYASGRGRCIVQFLCQDPKEGDLIQSKDDLYKQFTGTDITNALVLFLIHQIIC